MLHANLRGDLKLILQCLVESDCLIRVFQGQHDGVTLRDVGFIHVKTMLAAHEQMPRVAVRSVVFRRNETAFVGTLSDLRLKR